MPVHWKIWFLGWGFMKNQLKKKKHYVVSINLRASQILLSIFSTLWWTLDLGTCKEHDFLKIKILLRLLVLSYWLKGL